MTSGQQHLFPEPPISVVGQKCWGPSTSLPGSAHLLTDRRWCINTLAPLPLGLPARGGNHLHRAFAVASPIPDSLPCLGACAPHTSRMCCLLRNPCLLGASGGTQTVRLSDSALSLLEISLTKHSHMCPESHVQGS